MIALRLEPTLEVTTPLGEGKAFIMLDYGLDVNTVWVVRMRGGIVKHFYSNDIRIHDNPMNGNDLDLDIPEGWRTKG